MPHAIENMGRTSSAVMLQVFAPMGPERVYRDPKDEAGRAAFEVIRDPSKAAAPAGAKLTVGAPGETLAVFGGKGKIKPLLEPAKTGSRALYVGLLEAEPGAEVPRNSHPGSAEILYVLSGGGEMTVGSEKIPFAADEALHLPDGQPHAVKFTGPDKTVMLQIFAPAGPEERYRAAPAAGGARRAEDQRTNMIDFDLSEDQRVLQASVREMCERADHPERASLGRGGEVPARDHPDDGRDGPARDADPRGVRRRRDEVPRLRHRAGGGRPRRRVDRADDGVAQLAVHGPHLPGRQRGAAAEVPAAAGQRQGAGRRGG